MARDTLAVPASGVGVERLFNMARDICHYRRSRLKAETISKLMIMKHFDNVILQEESIITDADYQAEQKKLELEEINRKVDIEVGNNIDISDGSDDGYDDDTDFSQFNIDRGLVLDQDDTQYTYDDNDDDDDDDDDDDHLLPTNQSQDSSHNDNVHSVHRTIGSSPPRHSNLYASDINDTIGTQIVNHHVTQPEDLSSNDSTPSKRSLDETEFIQLTPPKRHKGISQSVGQLQRNGSTQQGSQRIRSSQIVYGRQGSVVQRHSAQIPITSLHRGENAETSSDIL